LYTIDNDAEDDIDEMNLVVYVSYVNWMMRWISCMSRKLHLSTCIESSLYS
jgi:hypothetical protein